MSDPSHRSEPRRPERSSSPIDESGVRPGAAVLLTLAAVAVMLVVGSVRLGAQGAYYDELHQATASFAWFGERGLFARGWVCGLPTFNMSYSGAIKSNLWGAWMWASGSPFTIEGWRWFGLGSGALGVLLFGVWARARLAWWRLAVLLFLIVTDATVVVCCRHDWGPVAFAFLLRMTVIAACLFPPRGPGYRRASLIGLLLGVAVFEKLSSLVLVAPALVLWHAAAGPHPRRAWALLAVGAAIGAAPVVLWNTQWLLGEGKLASLFQSGAPAEHSVAALGALAREMLVMPQGGAVGEFVFGVGAGSWREAFEAALLLVGLALAVMSQRPLARVAALAFGLTVLTLFLLPSRTGVHHWVLATPWQYLAVALALTPGAGGRALRVVVGAWLALRVVTVATLLTTLMDGAANPRWTPELHRLAATVAARAPDDLYLAGDWGVGTQMACAARGNTRAYAECYTTAELPPLGAVKRVVLVGLQPPSTVSPASFDALQRQLDALPGWRAAPLPPDLEGLRDLRVAAWMRRD
ncbi:MAG: hypothetical protein H6835_17450 [Planctomycetes bacterium]|nr:hypothetical protein [Planctomycetota bacterium]